VGPEGLRRDTEILERAAELAEIETTLEAARSGAGRCLVVWGGAGLGKSSLIDTACDSAQEASMTVLRARGGELERDFTFGVGVQLFERMLAEGGRERSALMAGAAALSDPLFSGGAPPSGAAGEYALLHGLHWLAANVAERAPLLIAVDDAHWSDASSLRWLVYLQQRLDELPIALIAAARPEEAGPQAELVQRVARHGVSSEISLAPLSDAAVGSLVRADLEEADEDLVAACAKATGGNPFYVRDFIAAVEAGGGLDGTGASASSAVLPRVESLSEPAPTLAEAVAVLGDEVPIDRAAQLASIDPDPAASAADALAAISILAPGAPLSFVHPLVREAIYSNIPSARRARAHARAAELLRDAGADPEQVASQLVEAHGAGGEWAAPALREAAMRASRRGSPAAAARYLRAAVDGVVAASDRGAMLAELAIAEAKAQEGDPGARAGEALDAIEAPRERARAALDIGMALVDASRAESAEIFTRGLEALDQSSEETGELAKTLRASRVAVAIGAGTSDPGDLEEIVARAEQGIATPAERLMLAHGALAPALRGESIDEVCRLARASLAGWAPDVTSPTAMAAYSLATTSLFMAGRFEESVNALTSEIERARERGAVLAFGTLSHVRAHALHRCGRLEDAIADAQSALDTVRYGWEPELPAIYAVLALCLIERGELEAAAAALEIPGGEKRWEATFTWADVLDARGRLRFAQGDARGGLEDCLAAGERLKPLGASHEVVVPWRTGAIQAALALGDAELGGELAGEAVEASRAFGAKRELGASLAAAGNAAGGDRGIALLREAVEALRESEATLELARALSELGGALLEENHRLAAREALTEALDLAHRCRADALEDVARKRLVATGARPRRASARGSDALTPRERRIATMAADGLGNREIAEALFITTKTVETHLGRAYRKLDISSRRDLPEAIAEEG
jgi:DNA-binding CsgD family transcriptional regulator